MRETAKREKELSNCSYGKLNTTKSSNKPNMTQMRRTKVNKLKHCGTKATTRLTAPERSDNTMGNVHHSKAKLAIFLVNEGFVYRKSLRRLH